MSGAAYKVMLLQDDFANEKSQLKHDLESRGCACLFLLKFDFELNLIKLIVSSEMVKWTTQQELGVWRGFGHWLQLVCCADLLHCVQVFQAGVWSRYLYC